MPTIPYVRNTTWADGSGGGTPITAAKLNVVENGIFEVSYAPAVRVFHNANQSITTGTETTLNFNSERFDQAGNAADTMHDNATNNSRLTCKYAGSYDIGVNFNWSASPATNTYVNLRLNGSTVIGTSSVQGDYRSVQISTLYSLAVNDYVEVRVFHSNAGAINVVAAA